LSLHTVPLRSKYSSNIDMERASGWHRIVDRANSTTHTSPMPRFPHLGPPTTLIQTSHTIHAARTRTGQQVLDFEIPQSEPPERASREKDSKKLPSKTTAPDSMCVRPHNANHTARSPHSPDVHSTFHAHVRSAPCSATTATWNKSAIDPGFDGIDSFKREGSKSRVKSTPKKN